jgi:hypothetical protein
MYVSKHIYVYTGFLYTVLGTDEEHFPGNSLPRPGISVRDALRHDRIEAPFLIESSANMGVFAAYVGQMPSQ